MNIITRSLNKFNKLFNLVKIFVNLLLLPLLILSFSIIIVIKIKFFNNLIDKLCKNLDEKYGLL